MSNTASAMGEVDKTIREGVRAVVEEAIMKSKPSATELLRTMEMLDSNLMTPVRGQILEAALMKLGQDFSLDIKKQWDDDKAKMEKSIRSLQRKEKQLTKERSMLLNRVVVTNAALKTQGTLLERAQGEITKLGEELLLTKKEETNGKRKMEEAHKTTLEKAQEECTSVRRRLRQVLLEKSSAEKAKNALQIDHERVKDTLAEEKEKSLCEICMHAQKDSVCLPCLHLRYCFECLEKHKQSSRTCPFCRVPLNGIIRSEISMFSN